MARRRVADTLDGSIGRPLLLACLLGLALLLGHQLVMASPWHAEEMSMGRGSVMLPAVSMPGVAAPADGRNPHATHGDRPPLTGWRECLRQEGVLPALLLLLAFAGLWWRLASVAPVDLLPRVGEQVAHFLRPPPLEPSRRRALLQVFLN